MVQTNDGRIRDDAHLLWAYFSHWSNNWLSISKFYHHFSEEQYLEQSENCHLAIDP